MVIQMYILVPHWMQTTGNGRKPQSAMLMNVDRLLACRRYNFVVRYCLLLAIESQLQSGREESEVYKYCSEQRREITH